MLRTTTASTFAAVALLAIACAPKPESGRGFRLPDGDAAVGERTFVEMQCTSCHTVDSEQVQLPEPAEGVEVVVELGGETTQVRTYGHLVTAIINPSHTVAPGYLKADTFSDGESLMQNYNQTMTVQQLTDLVAFLQAHYQVVPPENIYLMP